MKTFDLKGERGRVHFGLMGEAGPTPVMYVEQGANLIVLPVRLVCDGNHAAIDACLDPCCWHGPHNPIVGKIAKARAMIMERLGAIYDESEDFATWEYALRRIIAVLDGRKEIES